MPIPLSEKTKRAAELLLAEPDRSRIEQRLVAETSEEIPMWREFTPEGLERIRFSVLKLIAQGPKNENSAFNNAKEDWRDLFMAAGFAESATEHERWYEKITNKEG
jgi:hypothetical protein